MLNSELDLSLMPDGLGTKASVAGPAKKPEVAMLHAVKALGSAQTNFAGGQGYYNFLTFLAPYFEGMAYDGIKQHMQMFVYEMTQMMVARGGQVVFSNSGYRVTKGLVTVWGDGANLRPTRSVLVQKERLTPLKVLIFQVLIFLR